MSCKVCGMGAKHDLCVACSAEWDKSHEQRRALTAGTGRPGWNTAFADFINRMRAERTNGGRTP